MEKKFEEKFGLKTEEMEEILGGLTSPGDPTNAVNSCTACSTCIYCSTCIGCTQGCTCCDTVAFVAPISTNTGIKATSTNFTDASTRSYDLTNLEKYPNLGQ